MFNETNHNDNSFLELSNTIVLPVHLSFGRHGRFSSFFFSIEFIEMANSLNKMPSNNKKSYNLPAEPI